MQSPRKKARHSKTLQELSNPPTRHVQHKSCRELGKAFSFSRCVSCEGNDPAGCRFRGVRILVKDRNVVVGIEYRSTQVREPEIDLLFPDVWNSTWSAEMIVNLKRIISKHLIPIISLERSHCHISGAVFRPHHADVHPLCDICYTSLFSGNWLCELCGREVCSNCYEELQKSPRASGRENKRNADCLESSVHFGHQFRPTSRFNSLQLGDTLKQMLRISVGWESDTSHRNPLTRTSSLSYSPTPSSLAVQEKSLEVSEVCIARPNLLSSFGSMSSLAHLIGDTRTISTPPRSDAIQTKTPSSQSRSLETLETHPRRIRRFAETALTSEVFEHQWAIGEPILVERSPSRAPQADWSASGFRTHYGSKNLELVDSQSYVEREGTVNEFMQDFGNYAGRSSVESWQANIEAWQFKEDFPLYYNDCFSAIPLPLYVGPSGPMNIAVHFPTILQAPDLGPVLQMAKTSYEHPQTNGTTRMSWSTSDIIDVMVYASPAPNGEPGSAVWDVFRAEDSYELRKFIDCIKAERRLRRADRVQRGVEGGEDEDEDEEEGVYLDKGLRDRLWQELKIAPYRVYQRSGESVMVPAECGYQICHLADCMNVQLDFVTAQSFERCEQMRKDSRSRKEVDHLHARWMMWFAWLSCCEQERRLKTQS